MAAERCRVCVHVHGQTQFYQRDSEQKRDGKWTAVPTFVINPREAVTMSEAQAVGLVHKLRGLRANPWIETHDGRRIDVPRETLSSVEDTRQPLIASLNDVDWFVIKPICRPEGRKWFLSIPVPGFPTNVVIYADDPLGVLQKADSLSYLQFAEKYQRPEPQQQVAPTFNGPRRRPGDNIR
jgi:hypothetical protein